MTNNEFMLVRADWAVCVLCRCRLRQQCFHTPLMPVHHHRPSSPDRQITSTIIQMPCCRFIYNWQQFARGPKNEKIEKYVQLCSFSLWFRAFVTINKMLANLWHIRPEQQPNHKSFVSIFQTEAYGSVIKTNRTKWMHGLPDARSLVIYYFIKQPLTSLHSIVNNKIHTTPLCAAKMRLWTTNNKNKQSEKSHDNSLLIFFLFVVRRFRCAMRANRKYPLRVYALVAVK